MLSGMELQENVARLINTDLQQELSATVDEIKERYPTSYAGIVVETPDENIINAGDTETPVFLGSMGKVPIMLSIIAELDKDEQLAEILLRMPGSFEQRLVEIIGKSDDREFASLVAVVNKIRGNGRCPYYIQNQAQLVVEQLLSSQKIADSVYTVRNGFRHRNIENNPGYFNTATLQEMHILMKLLTQKRPDIEDILKIDLQDPKSNFTYLYEAMLKAMEQTANATVELGNRLNNRTVYGKAGWFPNLEMTDLAGYRTQYDWEAIEEEQPFFTHLTSWGSSETIFTTSGNVLVTYAVGIPHYGELRRPDYIMREVTEVILDPIVKRYK